jgi:hypothetical protein
MIKRDRIVPAPDGVQEPVAAEQLVGMGHQVFQQGDRLGREA